MLMELLPTNLTSFYSDASWFDDPMVQAAYEKRSGSTFAFLAADIAFVHDKGIAHKHLKGHNVLIHYSEGRFRAKLTDFGLSKLKLESSSNGAVDGGEATVRWRAPETFTREYARVRDKLEAERSADVWALGMVLWEMAIRKKPFAELTEAGAVARITTLTQEQIEYDYIKPLEEQYKNSEEDDEKFIFQKTI